MTTSSSLEARVFPALRKKQLELAYIPPQYMGRFDSLYHRLVPYMKVAPWRVIAFWAILATVFLRLALGSSFASFASLLQRAF